MAATMELTRITTKQTLISESYLYASFSTVHTLPFGATEDCTGGATAIPSTNGPAGKKPSWTSRTMLLRTILGIYMKKSRVSSPNQQRMSMLAKESRVSSE
jgi:hypothetical protein